VTTDFGFGEGRASAVIVQADGKIVAAGDCSSSTRSDFCLARYNANGSLDSSFGADGKVTTDFGGSNDFAAGVVVQADGKIVAAGSCWRHGDYFSLSEHIGFVDYQSDFCLARYNLDGSPDRSFDGDGRVTTDIGAVNEWAEAVAIQPDGKIVVAGSCISGPNYDSNYDFCLTRYNSNGALDRSFDGDGKVATDIGSYGSSAAVQADSKIVAAGTCGSGGAVFCVVRFNINGSLDTTFDGDGKVTTAIGAAGSWASSLAVQADAKIVVAGTCEGATWDDWDFCLARYNSDGSLDTTFDGDGKVITAIRADRSWLSGVAVQADAKIVAAGSCMGVTRNFCLAHYNSDGSLDTTFDGDGKVITAIGTGVAEANAVAVQGDGKIVAAGRCTHDFAIAFCLARYQASPSSVAPAAPSTFTATPVSRSQIALHWTDNATNETGFKIEQSRDGSSGWRQIATVAANVTSYTHSRQPAATTFYYRVRATNAAGDSAYSNIASATTLG
jgi:uncharacterized delta-60 repeat protein